MPAKGERNKALTEKRKTYFTGKPCVNGHVCDRLVSGGCVECLKVFYRRSRLKRRDECQEQFMLWDSRRRAKKHGLVHDIDVSDIFIPEVCPLLGIEITKNIVGQPTHNSPSLDRIDNRLGYVKGNVWVISHRANTLKSNASLEELERLVSKLRDAHGYVSSRAMQPLANFQNAMTANNQQFIS